MEVALDRIAIRSLGLLGYDELNQEERVQYDEFETGTPLPLVAGALLHLLREGRTLSQFLRERRTSTPSGTRALFVGVFPANLS